MQYMYAYSLQAFTHECKADLKIMSFYIRISFTYVSENYTKVHAVNVYKNDPYA